MLRSAAVALLLSSVFCSCSGAETLELPEPPKEQATWEPSGELASLLKKMDEAGAASRKVFAPLSAEQMNWRPPNGTHTPRWNAEHMAATQLMLFSKVYAELDPAHHKAIRINPKQMPDDYRAAHPDWTGEQEAEQMKRIGEYVRGYAYLLEGRDLDAEAPGLGGRWTLRKLLGRMESHYNEHTANVKKKRELPEWPGE